MAVALAAMALAPLADVASLAVARVALVPALGEAAASWCPGASPGSC
jgi:hypothetical protein